MANYNVGGGGDPYADIDEALADIPSVRTEDHNILLDKASEYVYTAGSATHIDFSGFSGNFYIRLRAKTGHSARENIVRGTNPLKYDTAYGAAIRTTGAYSILISIASTHIEIFDLLLKVESSTTRAITASGAGGPALVDRVFLDSAYTGSSSSIAVYGSAQILQRTYAYMRGSGGNALQGGDGALVRFCAAVRNSEHSAAGRAYSHSYGAKLQNCVAYGFTEPATSSGWSGDSWNNATEQSSGFPGSNNEYSIADPYEDRDDDTLDVFAVTGSDLEGEGLADAGVTVDFFGTTYASPPAIGPDQFTGGGGGGLSIPVAYYHMKMQESL